MIFIRFRLAKRLTGIKQNISRNTLITTVIAIIKYCGALLITMNFHIK